MRSTEEIRRLVSYVSASVIGLAVDLGGLYFLHEFLGVPVGLASGLSFLLSALVNFLMNQRVTFKAQAAGSSQQMMKYGILVGCNTLATAYGVAGLAAIGVNYLVAKLFMVGVLFVVNYFLLRIWVFAGGQQDRQ